MKQLALTSFMSLGLVFGSAASGSTLAGTAAGSKTKRTSETRRAENERMEEQARERADQMTNAMIRDLQLNNYQAKKIREINLAKVREMMQLEAQYANEPELASEKCLGACNARDPELEEILSTEQYSKYFGWRNKYFNQDQSLAGKLSKTKAFSTAAATPEKSAGGVSE